MRLPDELIKSVVEGGAVAFVGAGLSLEAGLPSWPMLLYEALDWGEKHGVHLEYRADLEEYIKQGELLLVAEEIRDQFGKDDFRRFLFEVFHQPGLVPTETHKLLMGIPFASVLTSNYDKLLESACTLVKDGESPHVMTQLDVPELSSALRAGFYILKIHGTIDRVETIVLGKNDYREVMHANPAYRHHLYSVFSSKTVFFIGFSLTDPDFCLLLDELRSTYRGYTIKHYALMETRNFPKVKQRRFERDYNISIIPYTATGPQHPEVKEVLVRLSKCINASKVSSVLKTQASSSPLEELAEEIRTWLQAIRYTIDESKRLDERTINIICKIDEGSFKQRVLVRCIGGEITPDDVSSIDKVLDRRTPQGWLISDKRVSTRARAYINSDESLRVFTLSDFLQDMVWGPYFEKLRSLVTESRIPDLYVDPSCYKLVVNVSGHVIEQDKYSSLDKHVDEWLNERGKMHLSILGEFGAGKTWFCRHYAYRQLHRYLEDPAHQRLPLLVTLRDFSKAMTAKQLINDALLEQYNLPFVGSAFEIFKIMNKQAKLLLILDGFDEMSRQVDYQTVVDNFWELATLVDENSKIILTSRTEYFRWAKESEKVLSGAEYGRRTIILSPPKFEVLYLEEFEDSKIIELIEKRIGKDKGAFLAHRILGAPNIAAMARKPILIELLLAALDDVSAGILENTGYVYLYSTNKLLVRNIDTKRSFTTTSDKLYFLCELAWEMIKNDELRIHYKDIPVRIKFYFGERIQNQQELDSWDYDLRNQTLLHRDAAGYYEFAHKSLAEYFVAFKFGAELGLLTKIFQSTYLEKNGNPCIIPFEKKSYNELESTFGFIPLRDERMKAVVKFIASMISDVPYILLWDKMKSEWDSEMDRYTSYNFACLIHEIDMLNQKIEREAEVSQSKYLYEFVFFAAQPDRDKIPMHRVREVFMQEDIYIENDEDQHGSLISLQCKCSEAVMRRISRELKFTMISRKIH